MADPISITDPAPMADRGPNPLLRILFSPIVKVVFLAVVVCGVFFFSEQNIQISKTDGFVEDIEDQESWAAGGNSQRRLAFLSCAAIGFAGLLFGRGRTFRFNLPIVLITIYLLWAGSSVLWSIDASSTVRRYILTLCSVIGCFGFCKLIRVKDAVLAAALASLIFLFLGVAVEVVLGSFNPLKGDYRFAGSMHPNIQAANLAIGSIAAYVMARVNPKAKFLFYGMFGVLFLFLVLTKCRSATATVPVSLGVIWIASQPSKNIFLGFVIAFWLGSIAALVCLISGFDPVTEYSEVLLLGRGEETGSSLTGRLPLWQDLSEYISFRPWQGYGFKAFWTPRNIADIAVSQEWTISEAHSSYIDATLQLGVIGSLLMFLTAFTTLLYAAITFRKTMLPEYLFLVGGVFFCIVRGFTESGLSGTSLVTSFLFLAIVSHSWQASSKLIDTRRKLNNDSAVPSN